MFGGQGLPFTGKGRAPGQRHERGADHAGVEQFIKTQPVLVIGAALGQAPISDRDEVRGGAADVDQQARGPAFCRVSGHGVPVGRGHGRRVCFGAGERREAPVKRIDPCIRPQVLPAQGQQGIEARGPVLEYIDQFSRHGHGMSQLTAGQVL